MSHLENHHDLAVMLLVGRSLSGGIPWTLEEDQRLIDRERALWELLSPDEQQWEQQFLAGLWRTPAADRTIPVNPEWGEWTTGVPEMVVILNEAFGMPHKAYRPDPKGPVGDGPWAKWLWKMGFQVVAEEGGRFTISIPATRVLQEADRLVTLFRRDYPGLFVNPWGDPDGGVQVLSSYDPIQKRTYMLFSFSFSSLAASEGKATLEDPRSLGQSGRTFQAFRRHPKGRQRLGSSFPSLSASEGKATEGLRWRATFHFQALRHLKGKQPG